MAGMMGIYSRLLVFITILALNLMALLYLMLYIKMKMFPGAWGTKVRHGNGFMIIRWSKS